MYSIVYLAAYEYKDYNFRNRISGVDAPKLLESSKSSSYLVKFTEADVRCVEINYNLAEFLVGQDRNLQVNQPAPH